MGTQGRAWSRRGIATVVFIGGLSGQVGHAQVTTDIRTDGSLGAKVALPGPQAEIPASLGRRAGKNLFHSFARFNVGTGDSATFTGPGGLDNVISRVTGGERSAIDGRLASKIPGADFWFINPAGLAFGRNASLDVPASFHVSTADELRFPGGEVFSATEPAKSVLSVASPEAFGFLGAKPASIDIEVGTGKRLSLSSPGETLSFTGGDITVTGGQGGRIDSNAIENLHNGGGGEIDLVSLASPGEVRLPSFTTDTSKLGTVHIKGPPPVGNQAQFLISSSGLGGGTIRIHGGRLVAEDVGFGTLNLGGTDATGGILINADEVVLGGANYMLTNSVSDKLPAKLAIEAKSLRITGTGAIGTFGTGGAQSGDVIIHADTIDILGTTGDFGIVAATITDAAGGTISITARESLSIGSRATISSSALAGSGPGGPIAIHADKELTVRDGARISADTFSGGAGGNITMTGNVIRLENGGQITGGANGSGPGGLIEIIASDKILMLKRGVISAETSGIGKAGQVSVSAPHISVNNSYIGANTSGAGNGGLVEITASGQLEFINEGRVFNGTVGPGDGADILVSAGDIVADKQPIDHPHVNHTGISASTQPKSSGRGGAVTVEARTITLRNGAEITSGTNGSGPGGVIDVTASDEILMSKRGVISGETSGTGNAGQVSVSAPRISVNNSFIGANTSGAGDGSLVEITASDQLEFINEGRVFNGTQGSGKAGDISVSGGRLMADRQPIDHTHVNHTGISASPQAGSSGQGGDVTVNTRAITLRNGAQITSDTKGTGNAGSVDVTTTTLHLENEGLIGTCSGAGPDCKDRISSPGVTGDAGEIVVRATDKIVLDDGIITTFARSENAEGGRITLQAGDLIYLKDSEVTSEVFGDRGTTAGDINITADMLVQNNSRILARATAGTGGNIRIIADNLVVSQDSAIDASSELGVDGTVATSTPEADVTSGLVVLPAAFLDAASRLRDSCAVRGAAEASRFSRAGRTLPPGPGDPQVVSYASAADTEAGASAKTDTFAEAPGALMIACGPSRP